MNIRDLPSILRTLLVCGPALISTACTNDQTVEDRLAETYLSRQRDSVITNWQARLLDEPRCDRFRQLHRTHGERFSSAASGGFVQAMQDVRNAAREAGCLKPGSTPHAATRSSSASPPPGTVAYRWKDHSGQWHLSDTPPAEGTDYEAIPLLRPR